MHRTLATLAILAALFAATTIHAANITIPCSADTTITSASPYANLGGKTNIPVGVSELGYKSRGLFRFDLTNIPPNARIVGAFLNIPVTFVPADGVTSTYELHRMNRSWTEGNKVGGDYGQTADPGEATWMMRTTQAWTGPGGVAGYDFLPFASGIVEISSTGIATFTSDALISQVAYFLRDPAENNGWMIHEGSESTRKTEKHFGTREDPANAPTLVINYIAPGAPLQITAIYKDGPSVVIAWSGGTPAYQIQSTDNPNGEWTNLGPITTQTSALIPISSSHQFFRIVGH